MEPELRPWEDEDVRPILERTLEKHLVALTAFVAGSDMAEMKQALLVAFRAILDNSPEENWAAPFEAAVQEAVDSVVALGPAAPPQILRDYRLLRELNPLIGYVSRTARDVVSGKVEIAPEMREELEKAGRRLGELNSTIKSECPYLLERMESKKPALRLNNPRWTGKLLGDASMDCRYVLGKSRFMSLELSHYYEDDRARAKRVGPPGAR